MINRKSSEKKAKNKDLKNQISRNEHRKFIEFLKFKELTEKKDLNSVSEKDREELAQFLKFQDLADRLKKKHKLSTRELLESLDQDVMIPVSIFKKNLGSLEAICKYLKENLRLSNKKISSLTGRSSKSIWQAYDSGKKKHPEKFKGIDSIYNFPVSILKNKNLGVLENIVLYLKQEFKISYHEIAVLLKRNDRTIWTVYQKAREKNVE